MLVGFATVGLMLVVSMAVFFIRGESPDPRRWVLWVSSLLACYGVVAAVAWLLRSVRLEDLR